MKVQCPNCSFTSQIDDAKVPDKEVKIRCPKCSTRFPIQKGGDAPIASKKQPPKPQKDSSKSSSQKKDGEEMVQCSKCRHKQHPRAACVYCGTPFPDYVPRSEPESAPSPPAPRGEPKITEAFQRSSTTVKSPLMDREKEADAEENDAELVRCPYCDERIRKKAIKCKHCQERLEPSESESEVGKPRSRSPVDALKGLIDFSFTRYFTPPLIKILYAVGMVVGAILMIIAIVMGFMQGQIIRPLLGILALFLYLLSIRVYAEILLVIFDIEKNTQARR